jgi:hypothetical protein
MSWWGWLLLAWAVTATVAASWLAAAAGIARRRERASRAYQYGEAMEQESRQPGQREPTRDRGTRAGVSRRGTRGSAP